MSQTKNIIFGKNPIVEALQADRSISKIFIAHGLKSSMYHLISELATQKHVPIREADRQKLSQMIGHENHQGIVAVVSPIQYGSLADIKILAQEKNELPLIALLDEIQDPHNLGAIIRSAEAFGIHAIIIPKDRAVGLTETVAKTSGGAIAYVNVIRVINLAQTIEELKTEGLWIVGTDQNSAQKIDEIDFRLSIGIVIGSEGKGIRRLIKEKCDFLVQIPMFGKINSLNASVAAAIAFWEARRQRR